MTSRSVKASGVEFHKEPLRMPHGGIDALFDDTCDKLVDLDQG
jgi:hypothetical protein